MPRETVTLFFGLLAIAAQAMVVVALPGGVFLRRGGPTARSAIRSFVDAAAPLALGGAAVVAWVCTLGSLYLSEVAHFRPCTLCWYQRIAMYPLSVLLTIAAIRRDHGIRIYAATMAAVGGSVSIYHMLVERFPSLESNACDPLNPCSLIWIEELGYLTIPTMALSGFALILVFLALDRAHDEATPPPDPQD